MSKSLCSLLLCNNLKLQEQSGSESNQISMNLKNIIKQNIMLLASLVANHQKHFPIYIGLAIEYKDTTTPETYLPTNSA